MIFASSTQRHYNNRVQCAETYHDGYGMLVYIRGGENDKRRYAIQSELWSRASLIDLFLTSHSRQHGNYALPQQLEGVGDGKYC